MLRRFASARPLGPCSRRHVGIETGAAHWSCRAGSSPRHQPRPSTMHASGTASQASRSLHETPCREASGSRSSARRPRYARARTGRGWRATKTGRTPAPNPAYRPVPSASTSRGPLCQHAVKQMLQPSGRIGDIAHDIRLRRRLGANSPSCPAGTRRSSAAPRPGAKRWGKPRLGMARTGRLGHDGDRAAHAVRGACVISRFIDEVGSIA